ncbi:MAG: FGGY-family carbohydrate kinase [Planctomycetia bacterium]|nr:FGGY-family carbohydrate kinase [Planctomycetia bacterium]
MYFLGIDNGGTMTKAALFDERGCEKACASRKVETFHPQPGWEEVEPESLWEANVAAIRDVLAISGIAPREIACVAGAGHGNGLYLVNGVGKPLLGIRSTDTRARDYVEKWQRDGVTQKLLPKTTQATWPAQPNALLRWLADFQPEILSQAQWLFMAKDYIRYRLTGEAFLERTDASGTSLLNNQTLAYDETILQAWGIEKWQSLLPPLAKSCDLCGKITPEAARQTGLLAGTPVAGGMFDIDAVGLAVGMTEENILCLISGTWGNNQYIARKPVVSEDVFMTTCYAMDGFYLMLEGSATSASNLEWMIREFFSADQAWLQNQGTEKTIYDLVNEEIAQTPPEEGNLVFLPYLYASPVHPDAKGALLGLEGWQRRGHLLRALCEGIVFGHGWHVERLLRHWQTSAETGKPPLPDTIRLAGGAARSPVWSQMFADILQTTVQIPEGTELGAFGAAIAASVACGAYPNLPTACREMVRLTRIYTPNPELAEVYARKQRRFRQLLEILRPHWTSLR